jgi:amino acid transporter
VISFTRIFTIVMFAAICFMLIVPMAIKNHNPALAAGISALFVAYLIVNILMWRRMKPRV